MGKASINWLKIAKYDLGAAENALDGGYYIKVFEHAHSALEKLLKGIIAENNQEPQKIHDLLRLASEALIENLQLEVKTLMRELDSIYMSTRYPDEFEAIYGKLDQVEARRVLAETKRTFKWLEKKIK